MSMLSAPAGASTIGFGAARARFGPAAQATPITTTAPFKNDVDVLNYALALEHLEATFYQQGLAQFGNQDFLNLNLQTSVRDYIDRIGQDEAAHVQTLTQVITQLGGAPVAAASYDFGYTDLASFLKVAMALENTGVAAYTGAAQYLIDNGDLLTAALTIHGVEARHAAYLNILNGMSPFPNAVDQPKTPSEVLAIAGPFIKK